jgi:RHS repeat-associated protein
MRSCMFLLSFVLSLGLTASEPWSSIDVNTAITGVTTAVGGDGFDIRASGADIWGTSDGFRYVYKQVSGDFDLRARVESVGLTDPWSKAGLMVRQSLAPTSGHAMIAATGASGFAFQHRPIGGTSTLHTYGGLTQYPFCWLRLVKVGNQITTYKAVDLIGVEWIQIGTTIDLQIVEPFYLGLCVTAHNNNLLCSAEFRNIQLTSYTVPFIGTGDGLNAKYYNGIGFTPPPSFTRIDSAIAFDWGTGAPGEGVTADNFSVHWNGFIQPQFNEAYTFYTVSDDGVRLWINNELVIENWTDHSPTENRSVPINLKAGQHYAIVIESYEKTGGATAKLLWSSRSTVKQVIPQTQLYSSAVSPVPSTGAGLKGHYFPSRDLSGIPNIRVDGTVDFNWGTGIPLAGVPSDNFSVRWTGNLQPKYSGHYSFHTISDDGVRLWVDNQLIINNWTDHGSTENSGSVALSAGKKYNIVMEYYERSGQSVAKLYWSSALQEKQPVPSEHLYPTTGVGFFAEYFDDEEVASKKFVRIDPQIDFNWGSAAPDPALQPEGFSVRWSGFVEPYSTGSYSFTATVDGGLRLWIGNTLVVDEWDNEGENSFTALPIALAAGQQYPVKMEYSNRNGTSRAKLEWALTGQSPRPTNSWQVYPGGTMFLNIPTQSPISPAYVEGTIWSPAQVTSTVNAYGSSTPVVTNLNGFTFFVSMPLEYGSNSLTVTHSGTGATESGSIEWSATDLFGKTNDSDQLLLRKGDSLLLTANGPGNALTIDANGDEAIDLNGVPSQKFPYTFTQAGTFLVTAYIDGKKVGAILVGVVEVDLSKPLACQVGYTRDKNVVINPPVYSNRVAFTAADSSLLSVTTKGYFDNSDGKGMAIRLAAQRRGTPILCARLGHPSGPIIAYKEIDEFTLEVVNRVDILENDDTDIGTVTMKMHPYIPNIKFNFNMFASQSTFGGGVRSFSTNSSHFLQSFDSVRNELEGILKYDVETPDGESKGCYTISMMQASSAEQEVGKENGLNPRICKAVCEEVKECFPDNAPYVVTRVKIRITQTADAGTYTPVFSGTGIIWTGDPAVYDCKTGGLISGSTEIRIESPGTYDVGLGGAHFEDCICAIRLKVTPEEVKTCINRNITFTATGEEEGGTYTWSAPGGTPETGTGPTFTTQFAEEGSQKTVSCSYTKDYCSCTKFAVVDVNHVRVDPCPIELCIGEEKNVYVESGAGNLIIEYPPDSPFELAGSGSGNQVPSGTIIILRGIKCGEGLLTVRSADVPDCLQVCKVTVKPFIVSALGEFPSLCVSPDEFEKIISIKKCADSDSNSQVRIGWTPDDTEIYEVQIDGAPGANFQVYDIDDDGLIIEIKAKKCTEGMFTLIPVINGKDEPSCKQDLPFTVKNFRVKGPDEKRICVGEETTITVSKCKPGSADIDIEVDFDESVVSVEREDGGDLLRLDQDSVRLLVTGIGSGSSEMRFMPVPEDPACEVVVSIDVTQVNQLTAIGENGRVKVVTLSEDGDAPEEPEAPLFVCADSEVYLFSDWSNGSRGQEFASFIVEPANGVSQSFGTFSNEPVILTFSKCGEYRVLAWCDHNQNFVIDEGEQQPVELDISVGKVESLSVTSLASSIGSVLDTASDPGDRTLWSCAGKRGYIDVIIGMDVCGGDETGEDFLWSVVRKSGGLVMSGTLEDLSQMSPRPGQIRINVDDNNYEFVIGAGCDKNGDGLLQNSERERSVQVTAAILKKITVHEVRNPENNIVVTGELSENSRIGQTMYCPGEPRAKFSFLLETLPNVPEAHIMYIGRWDDVIGSAPPGESSIYNIEFSSNPAVVELPSSFDKYHYRYRAVNQLFIICADASVNFNPDAIELELVVESDTSSFVVDANHDGITDDKDAWCPAIFSSGFDMQNHLKPGERIKVQFYPFHYNHNPDSTVDRIKVRGVSLGHNVRTIRLFDAKEGGNEILPLPISPGNPILEYRNVPSIVFVECLADEVFGFQVDGIELSGGDALRTSSSPSWSWGDTYPIVHLSNGLGAPDSISAFTEIIPGHASVNVATGNLYFGDTVSSYSTPAIAPSVTLSYNHLDGIGHANSGYSSDQGEKLQRGWRTNYSMRVFDGSPFRETCDGPDVHVPQPEDRRQGDVLALIDETGKRRIFRYEGALFKSEKSGWPGATVDANRNNFTEVADAEYKLNRSNNLFYYFDANGDLIEIRDFRDNKLKIEVGKKVTDDFGRSENIKRDSFDPTDESTNFGLYLDAASGRQLGSWKFKYEGAGVASAINDPETYCKRIKSIELEGEFSHGSKIEYKIEYESNSNKVRKVTMPEAGGDSFVKEIIYIPLDQLKASTQTTVKEPFGGQTVFKIKPELDAVIQIKNAVGQTVSHDVDEKSRRLKNFTLGAYSVNMSYDNKGNMVTQSVNGGASMSYTYGSQGIEDANLLTSTSTSGVSGSTRFTYGGSGNSKALVEQITDALNNTTRFNYVAKGFLGSTIDARGNTWAVSGRNAYGQPTGISTPAGRTMSYEYNNAGRTTSYTEPLMRFTTTYEYDNRQRQTKTTQPGGAYSEVTLDPLSRVLTSRDLNERVSTFKFDAIGRTTQVTQPGIAAVNISYVRTGTGFNIEKKRGSRILSKEKIDFIGRTTDSTVLRSLNGTDATECSSKIAYKTEGWVDYLQDPLNGRLTYAYEPDGKVKSITSPASTVTRFEYDGARRVTNEISPDGQVSKRTFDSLGRVETATNPEGGVVTYKYDAIGNVERITTNDGSTPILFTYDNDGVQLTKTDVLGRIHKLTIEEASKTFKMVIDNNPDRTVSQKLDGRANVESISQSGYGATSVTTRPDGVVTTAQPAGRGLYKRTLDSLDRLRSLDTPNSTSSINFDAQQGDFTSQNTSLSLEVTSNVNAATGDIVSANDNESTGSQISRVIRRDKNGNVLEYLDGENLTWKQEFDANSRRIKVISPDNVETVWNYSPGGNRVQSVVIGGEATSYEYNGLDQVTKVTDNSGKFVTSTYDKFGRLETTTGGGYTTVRSYQNGTKLLESVTAPGGRVTRYLYDSNGRVTDLIDPRNNTTKYDYNDFDQVTKITHPDASFETFGYYANGDLETHLDRGSRITKFFYDGSGRLAQKQFVQSGETVSYTYNAANQVLAELYSDGTSVSRTYDKRGRLRTVNHGNGSTTTYTYRNDDMIATKTYAGKSITYQYTPNGRLSGITGDLGNATFGYYPNGRVQAMALPNNVSRQFGYDGAGRIATMTQTLGSTSPNIENYSYGYDGAGKLSSLNCNRNAGQNWNLGLQYDTAGRLEVETRTGEGAYQQLYEYDNNDNRTKVTRNPGTQEVRVLTFNGNTLPGEVLPASGTWTVTNGKLFAGGTASTSAALNTGSTTGKYSVKIQVDPASVPAGSGRVAGVEFGIKPEGRYLIGLTVSKFGADTQRQLQLYWLPSDTGIPQFISDTPPSVYNGEELTVSFSLINDSITARIVHDASNSELTNVLAHDGTGAVGLATLSISGGAAEARFDDFSWTRILAAAEVRDFGYNSFNQLLTVRGAEHTDFSYDAAGRLSTRTRDNILTTFTHDRLDRLVGLNVGGSTHTFGYAGPSWIRTSSTVDGVSTNFIYDGHACIAQTTGGKTTHYAVFGSKPLWEQTDNINTVYAQDGRGSVTGLWTGSDFAAKFVYDGFGRMFATDSLGNPLATSSGPRFQSEFFDSSSDLVYLRNRFYDPVIARFMSLDPKGMVDGPNMYGYCGGDPVNNTDPMGTTVKIGNEVHSDGGVPIGMTDMDFLFAEMSKSKNVYTFRNWNEYRQIMSNQDNVTWILKDLGISWTQIQTKRGRYEHNDSKVLRNVLLKQQYEQWLRETGEIKNARNPHMAALAMLGGVHIDVAEVNAQQMAMAIPHLAVAFNGVEGTVNAYNGDYKSTALNVAGILLSRSQGIEFEQGAVNYAKGSRVSIPNTFILDQSQMPARLLAARRVKLSKLGMERKSARLAHDEYLETVRPGATERVFETPWSAGKGLGSRKFDDFDDLTMTGFEANTTPWAEMTLEQLARKLDQVAADFALLKTRPNEIKRVIWFGTEELPTSGLGSQLREALEQAGIPYFVVKP